MARFTIWRILMAVSLLTAAAQQTLAAQAAPVETAMRHVHFHVDSSVVLQIDYLRGRLSRTRAEMPPTFDDPRSFTLEMDTATITVSMQSLTDLLNRYVFNYDGSPLRSLTVSIEKGQLKQSGHLHGLPFTILCDMSVTPTHELRLHPTSIKVLGIGAKGLMKLFGLSLQKLANVRKAIGVRIEGDDVLLTPAMLLPPPQTRGTLVGATQQDSSIMLRFGGTRVAAPLVSPDPGATNYMYFKGSVLRFGSLTMSPADLLVVDHDPRDPFDFWLAKYTAQLVAGTSRTTSAGGLITAWPDYNDWLVTGRSTSHPSRP